MPISNTERKMFPVYKRKANLEFKSKPGIKHKSWFIDTEKALSGRLKEETP